MSETSVSGDERNRDDLIFQLISQRLNGEGARSNGLDNKAGNLIGFTSVVIGLLLGSITLKFTILVENPILSFPYFLGIGVLLLSICFSLMVIKVRSWTVVPNVKYLLKNYTTVPYSEVLRRNAGTMADAVEKAESHNANKARYIEFSWYSLLSGLILVFVFMILYVVGVDL